MKISRTTLTLSVCIVLSILTLSNLTTIVHADEGTPLSGIQIDRLSDGTSVLTDNIYGYKLITPSGWYPIAIPSSSDEIDRFNNMVLQNNLPIGKEFLPGLPTDVLRFVVVDLDSKHYANDKGGGLVAAPFTSVTRFMPSGAIAPIIGLIRLSGMVTNSYITEISDQEVGVIEFSSSPDDVPYFGGKILLFIRNGKVFAIVGVSNQENVSNMIAIIDQIIVSLEFFDFEK